MDPLRLKSVLQWRQTGPKTFGRRLDSMERFYQLVGSLGQGRPSRSNWSITMGIKVNSRRDTFVTDIREAWAAMRFEYPSIAAFVENGGWVYNVADHDEMNRWLVETFHVHVSHRSARQLYPFEERVNSRRATVHVLPHTQEIVIQGPHTHLDGLGMAMILDAMMKHMVAPPRTTDSSPNTRSSAAGAETAKLLPPLEVITAGPAITPSQEETYRQSMREWADPTRPVLKLRTRNADGPAAKTRLRCLTFNAMDTQDLVRRTKQLGFTVTAALQAALSRAGQIQAGSEDTVHHQAIMAIYNARDKVDTSRYPAARVVGPSVFVMPAVFPIIQTSFAETARCAQKEFLRFRDDDVVRAASNLWAEDSIAAMSGPAPTPGTHTPADLNLSSLGIVDRTLARHYEYEGEDLDASRPDFEVVEKGRPVVDVMDVFFGLDLLHPNILVDVWTFRERLHIELIYNEAFHSEDSISLLCSLIHEQLSDGLGLSLQYDCRAQGEEEWLKRDEDVEVEVREQEEKVSGADIPYKQSVSIAS